MEYGCMGKVLWVDLSKGTFKEEEIPDQTYEDYLTGVGLAARLLYDRIPKDADPLGPDNILGLTAGFLCGTTAFFMGRWMACGKSPLTGGWGDSNCGGNFAPAIKKAGYDAIFFKGQAKKPVYLKIQDGKKELADASDLWGVDAMEAEKRIIEEMGGNTRVAVIGPAGEKLSLISGIVNDKGRIAARSGMGAVMGSKKLKAVAISGKAKVKSADSKKIKVLNQKFNKWLKMGTSAGGKVITNKLLAFMGRFQRVSPMAMAVSGDLSKIVYAKYGTIVNNVLGSENGDSPVKNWTGSGHRDYPIATHANELNPQKIIAKEVKKYRCYSCPLGCGGIMQIDDGKYPIGETHKVEYETCCAFGALILNKDLDTVYKVNDLLNRAGMDTISAGGTVAFAIECYEQGVLTKEDLDGLDLSWGNAEAVVTLVEKMIAREGIGDLLADGSKCAARKIGKGSEKFAVHAGGQELPMHDVRFDPGFAVSYALEPTPGRHTNHGYMWLEMFALHKVIPGLPKTKPFYSVKSKYDPKNKWILQVAASKYMQLYNAVGGCLFGAQMGGNLPIVEYLNATGGWNHSPHYYLKIGERIQNLRQAFNIKHGVQPLNDFALPRRVIGDPPLDSGPMKGVTLPYRRLCDDFLEGMGWDKESGKPTRKKLEELGLSEIADEIEAP